MTRRIPLIESSKLEWVLGPLSVIDLLDAIAMPFQCGMPDS